MSKLTMTFPSDDERDRFISWLSYSGEQYYMSTWNESEVVTLNFDYSKAFEAWGYDPERDGDPEVDVHILASG